MTTASPVRTLAADNGECMVRVIVTGATAPDLHSFNDSATQQDSATRQAGGRSRFGAAILPLVTAAVFAFSGGTIPALQRTFSQASRTRSEALNIDWSADDWLFTTESLADEDFEAFTRLLTLSLTEGRALDLADD